MTDHPADTPEAAQTPQDEPQDPRLAAWTEAAMAQESEAAMASQVEHFRRRVVGLNVEVRARDARIAELEAALAERQDMPSSGEPDA